MSSNYNNRIFGVDNFEKKWNILNDVWEYETVTCYLHFTERGNVDLCKACIFHLSIFSKFDVNTMDDTSSYKTWMEGASDILFKDPHVFLRNN